jgi:hypothetical protein
MFIGGVASRRMTLRWLVGFEWLAHIAAAAKFLDFRNRIGIGPLPAQPPA